MPCVVVVAAFTDVEKNGLRPPVANGVSFTCTLSVCLYHFSRPRSLSQIIHTHVTAKQGYGGTATYSTTRANVTCSSPAPTSYTVDMCARVSKKRDSLSTSLSLSLLSAHV